MDIAGTLTIIQGNGYCDTVNVDSFDDTDTTVNNVFIAQGDNIFPTDLPGCVPGCPDTVNVNDTDITSNLTILQGIAGNVPGGAEDAAAVGGYIINIATGSTGPVNAGGATFIQQAGAGNTVILGGNFGGDDGGEPEYTGFDFTTDTLTVWTGAGGDAFVSATNVSVSVITSPMIDGGGTGNVFEDGGGNTLITIGNFNNS
jgi:hypothetical protein